MTKYKIPRLRMFAGPNGSGKSTIKNKLPKQLLGVYLNADDIELEINQTGQFNFSAYQAQVQDALAFLKRSPRLVAFLAQIETFEVKNNSLVFTGVINSYIASALVDFLRDHLLAKKISFTFETVMSHASKVEFLQQAQQAGFKTYLYYVATISPDINISRVAYRVKNGGHFVPSDKVIERYYRSLDLLIKAIDYSDRAYIFDNSTSTLMDSVFIAEITQGQTLKLEVDSVPWWFKRYVLDKF